MEQHPVPQHIASFEFKLFGNLTVRQFVTLAIPVVIGFLIYFSGLPFILRIILAGAFGLFGLFAALVPIGGRPFDKWVVSFVRAVLSPTQRVWVKESRLPEFLSVVVAPSAVEQHAPESITAQGRQRLREYLRSLPKGSVTPLDVREQIAISRLGLVPEQATGGKLPPPIIWPTAAAGVPLFTQGSIPQVAPSAPVSMAQAPVAAEKFEGKLEASLPVTEPFHARAAPKITVAAKPFALPGLERKLKAKHKEETVELVPQVKAQLASEANFTVESVIPIHTPGKQIKLIHGIGKTRARKLHFAPPEGFDLSKLPIRGERRFEISEELKKRFSSNVSDLFAEKASGSPMPIASKEPEPEESFGPRATKGRVSPTSVPKQAQIVPKPKVATNISEGVTFKPQEKVAQDARISISGQPLSRAMPGDALGRAQMVPLTNNPNVISGIVMNGDGEPLERVILVVRDSHGIPVRALKTNRLGQFLSATPLSDGAYTVEVESDAYQFKPFEINLTGKVIVPMEVKPEG